MKQKAIRLNQSEYERLATFKAYGSYRSFTETLKNLFDYIAHLYTYKEYCEKKGIDIDA